MKWWRQQSPPGEIVVVATDTGIRAIGLPGEELAHLVAAAEPERDPPTAEALDDWFSGTGDTAGIPLDLHCSIVGFRRDVLETLHREVGWGETVSYGELGEMVGRPRAGRAVGRVMATNPVPFVIPCHRVIASDGRIGGYGGVRGDTVWVDVKRDLLAREGVHPRP